jgi:hypothetical protein
VVINAVVVIVGQARGPRGPAGSGEGEGGLPVGGTTGQALLKQSVADGDADWATLLISMVSGLQAALDAKQATSEKGAANGYAPLDAGSLVADAYIPASIARDSEVTAAVSAAVNALVGAAPGTLDTLSEIADALQDNPNVITDLIASIGTKIASTLLDAQSVLMAISDNTPIAQVIDEGEMFGRLPGGNLGPLTAAQVRTLIDLTAQIATAVAAHNAATTDVHGIADTSTLLVVVEHGSDPGVPRPAGAVMVLWKGDVLPNEIIEASDWWEVPPA